MKIPELVSSPAMRRILGVLEKKPNMFAIGLIENAYHQTCRIEAIPAGRILLGEFGVYREGADPAARLALIDTTRVAAEAAGFAWAVFTAGLTTPGQAFAVVGDTDTLALEPEVKTALGLR